MGKVKEMEEPLKRLLTLDDLIGKMTRAGRPWKDLEPLYKNRHALLREIAGLQPETIV